MRVWIAAVLGGAAALVGDDVRVAVAQQLAAGGTSRRRQIWLPIVPDGTKTAASWPNIAGDLLLERDDARILAVDVVADLAQPPWPGACPRWAR